MIDPLTRRRYCERSEATILSLHGTMDCFAALAMTIPTV
jgi:hypothetical protein